MSYSEGLISSDPTSYSDTPRGQDLGAGGSWFGSSLLSKAPTEDIRKSVERAQPSKVETPHSRKGRHDDYYGMRSETPEIDRAHTSPQKPLSPLSEANQRKLLSAGVAPCRPR